MADIKKTAKAIGRGTLTISIVATELAKEGLNFTNGLCKVFLGGAENLAEQMVGKGLKLGIGSYLLEKTEKAINWGFNQLIAGQKAIKGKLR